MCSSTLGALSRVDEGKKRLASWEVLHMLEEGVMRARPKTEELGHIWYQEVAQGGLITSRHGMGSPGGAHAGGWWPEMTRITDCSAGLGCFEERVGGRARVGTSKTDRQTATYDVDAGHGKLALRCEK